VTLQWHYSDTTVTLQWHYNHYNHYRDRDSDLDLDLDWGVVIYNQIVTWTAFAILAMFSSNSSKSQNICFQLITGVGFGFRGKYWHDTCFGCDGCDTARFRFSWWKCSNETFQVFLDGKFAALRDQKLCICCARTAAGITNVGWAGAHLEILRGSGP